MDKRIIARVIEWIQAMSNGETIDITNDAYVYKIVTKGNDRVYLCFDNKTNPSKSLMISSFSINDLFYFAKQQIEKEENL